MEGSNNVISNTKPVSFQNLTNSGTTTIQSGTIVTVTSTITSTGSLTIENGASLVQPTGGLVSGTKFTVNRNGASNLNYNLWSSPVTSATTGVFKTYSSDILKYSETSRNTTTYTTGWLSAAGETMTPGTGYAIAYSPGNAFPVYVSARYCGGGDEWFINYDLYYV